MIKVGITGGHTPLAAELLRILVNHPDVEIISVHSPQNAGKPVATVHHGFIGERRLLFTSNFDASNLDVVFIIDPIHSSFEWRQLMVENPGLKMIVHGSCSTLTESLDTPPLFGLSEINRKGLVRGARVASLPDPVSSLAMIALYPLASHLMVPNQLSLNISLPGTMLPHGISAEDIHGEIIKNLALTQSSFTGSLPIEYADSGRQRGMSVEFSIPGDTPLDELFKLYDSIYDDHNFTFMVPFDVDYDEVEGTNKCIITISKPDNDTIRIRGVADAYMRGNAAEAVHIMNLMSGLFEKTGLTFKTTNY